MSLCSIVSSAFLTGASTFKNMQRPNMADFSQSLHSALRE